MLIVNNESEEIYETIEDATAAQIAAYTGATVIRIQSQELVVDNVVVDHVDQDVFIFAS